MSLALGALLVALAPQAAPSGAEPLVLAAAIELPGVEGRLDHLAVDLARGRLFVAALGNDSVEVVDLAAARRTRTLRGPKEPQGILYLSDLDRLVVASGASGTCEVYAGDTLERLASVAVGADADNLRYDPERKLVYVGCEDALGVVDAATWSTVARIPLDGHAEGFQLDRERRRAFVAVPGARRVAVLDVGEERALAGWEITEAGGSYPLVMVPGDGAAGAGGFVLLGCRSPAALVVRALESGAPAQVVALSGDVDDLFHDARRRRVYASCGEGFLDVFEQDAAGFRRSARVPTAVGARTCLFVPERDRIFVAVPERGEQRAEVRVLVVR